MYEISGRSTNLLDLELLRRRQENLEYMMELSIDNLLLHHAFEAGMVNDTGPLDKYHGGWESPICQLRGHFVGHWLSAAAMHYSTTGDTEIKARADIMVSKIAEYQKLNGGQWAAPIPEKYLNWISYGKKIWAPQYTIHKTFMGLLDMYILADNQQALTVATDFARWFYDWSGQFSGEQWDDILDVETGGMLEIWAELYEATKLDFVKELMYRYDRKRLFNPLLGGQDVLTNMHANTTIPEVLGAARAFEVTGEQRWMDIVTAFWDMAVEKRGAYCTGGNTCGEIWSPIMEISARLGDKNQEHCTVYNMMRLADFLFRHTGESKYADYWEQNLYNGIMAQGYWRGSFTHGAKSQYPHNGLLTYFLPLKAGSKKGWSSKTQDFFCCHGSLVQANASHNKGIYYGDEYGFHICQYIASQMTCDINGNEVTINQIINTLSGGSADSSVQEDVQKINSIAAAYPHKPQMLVTLFKINCSNPASFKLSFRLPWWCYGKYQVFIDGQEVNTTPNSKGFIVLENKWSNQTVELRFDKKLSSCPMPDRPDMVAFLDGPVVLAGLCSEERTLYGDADNPYSMLTADNEREWSVWQNTYRTIGQDRGIPFIPLYKVGYDTYSVYFPVKKAKKL